MSVVMDSKQDGTKGKTNLLMDRIQKLGIRENCQDYHEYIRAKKLVEDLASSPCEFDALIHIVIDYIGI